MTGFSPPCSSLTSSTRRAEPQRSATENGRTAVPLVGEGNRPATAHEAWDADWSATALTVGVDVAEEARARDRGRQFAPQRFSRPHPDAYLAEILAAESDY
jgi:hypothetical protein